MAPAFLRPGCADRLHVADEAQNGPWMGTLAGLPPAAPEQAPQRGRHQTGGGMGRDAVCASPIQKPATTSVTLRGTSAHEGGCERETPEPPCAHMGRYSRHRECAGHQSGRRLQYSGQTGGKEEGAQKTLLRSPHQRSFVRMLMHAIAVHARSSGVVDEVSPFR